MKLIKNTSLDNRNIFLQEIINQAFTLKASDIHIEPTHNSYCIRIRIDGDLKLVKNPSMINAKKLISQIKILSNLDIAETRLPQDGCFNFIINNSKLEIRTSTCSTIYGERLALRILYSNNFRYKLEKIGLLKHQYFFLKKLLQQSSGIILFTGPTGSGKTSTIYSVLKNINSIKKNILTIEDPVEVNIDNVSQTCINPKINLSFNSILKSFLRQDPDIIMLGEIRDEHTARTAFSAALSGHFIITSLHSDSAHSSIARLSDLNINKKTMLECIKLIVNQRLLKVLCNNCKIEKNTKLFINIDKHIIDKLNKTIFAPNSYGCKKCNSGFIGRKAVFELLIKSKTKGLYEFGPRIKDIVINNINNGITSIEELLKVS